MIGDVLVYRPEAEYDLNDESFGVVERPISQWRRLYEIKGLRKLVLLVLLAGLWQLYAAFLDNPLLFPRFSDTIHSFWANVASRALPEHVWVSLKILLKGYLIGACLAAVITTVAISTRLGNDLLEILTSMFNPLPAIALLPLALLWFGLGDGSLVFVLVHSVLWPVTLNTFSGFRAVSPTLGMVGRNYGLIGPAYVARILIPAAFPSILTGLKIGWAFAWRTLIAAELVFGVSAGSGGLGWFIFENKNTLEIPAVFAGLFCVILIGLIVDNLIFRAIENHTIQKWGMHT